MHKITQKENTVTVNTLRRNKVSPRGRRDDMPPPPTAVRSKNRGGSTSVHGWVSSPHISGGWRWRSCRQPACSCAVGQTDGRTDGRIALFHNKMVTCLSFRSPHAVASWKPDGAEAINSDTEDGVDGTEAGRVVERQPEIAENFTHRPRLLRQNVHRVQRH